MITQNGIAPFVAFRYERIILAVEETTSANRCGSSLAAFSRPASACPSDSVGLLTKSVFKNTALQKVHQIAYILQ